MLCQAFESEVTGDGLVEIQMRVQVDSNVGCEDLTDIPRNFRGQDQREPSIVFELQFLDFL